MSAMRAPRLKKDMWTEVTKDLVCKEAIDEMGYDYEETEDFFYVIDYLHYVSLPFTLLTVQTLTCPTGGCPQTRRTLRRDQTRASRAHQGDSVGA